MRTELCDEAIRLGRLLAELAPQEPEALGLLALMLLIDARRDARVDESGGFVKLVDQDRRAWNRAQIEEALGLLRICLARDAHGPYQIQAAINAVHDEARTAAETDWQQVLGLYDQLMAIAPSPVVALNRAVVVAELAGADVALRIVEALELPNYHLFHAVRAELLRRAGRDADAAKAYQDAINRCENLREREFLQRQYESMARH